MFRKNVVLAATIAITSGLLLASPAQAATPPAPPDDAPDRTVYIDSPAPQVSIAGAKETTTANGSIALRTTEGAVFPVTPEPGETVRVVYTNAVADISRAGSCTESVTTYTPYKSGNSARVNAAFTVSTGCSGARRGYVLLYAVTLAAQNDAPVSNNGYTTSFSASYTCANTRSRSWYGIARLGATGGTYGPSATLACDQP